jgi:hypothetical protein
LAVKQLAALALAGCALWQPPLQPGDDADAVRSKLGPPAAEYPLPDGSRKWAYPTGPFGKHTTMVSFDAAGRVLAWEEALTEARFDTIEAGLTQRQLLERLGPPGRVWAVRYHDQTVWTYRYDNTQCKVFHVGLTPQGVVEDASYGPDPMCERDGLFLHGWRR